MYYDYFGLKQPPFKITPDTSMFFPGGNRGAILNALIYTILNGEGIIKVVGEVGSGKTMLCRMLEKELSDKVEVVYIANPSLSPENILHAIAFDLDLAVQTDTSRLEVMNRIQSYLLEKHSSGQHVVIFIEEAQSMPIATLEEIRLLSNLETRQNKLLQIVLFGQPELDTLISQREIRQLKERITYSFQLNPFNTNDIRDYLNTRLRASGYRSGEIFEGKAVKLIEKYSAGLVRRINILADKAMLAAYASNINQVTARHVRQAARDSEFVSGWVFGYGRMVTIASVLVTTGLVVIGLMYLGSESTDNQADSVDRQRYQPGQTSEAEVNAVITEATAANQQMDPSVTQAEVNTSLPEPVSSADVSQESEKLSIDTDSYDAPPEPVAMPEESLSVIKNKDVDEADHQELQPVRSMETEPQRLNADAVEISPGTQALAVIETQLMGLEGMFTPTDMGNTLYTDEELQLLREQLERYPPEVGIEMKPSAESDTCKLCWSFIYRPLIKANKQ